MNNFCRKCGTALLDGVCPKCTHTTDNGTTSDINKNEEKYTAFFMSPKEKLVTTLGNTYIQNFFNNGAIRKGFSVVSDKRVYFQGTSYDIRINDKGKRKIIKTHRSKTVDLKDVTGTGFERFTRPFFLALIIVFGITQAFCFWASAIEDDFLPLFIISLISFIIMLYKYIQSRKNLITIQFAGGQIAFDVKWFGQDEIADFQKKLRLAKDKAIEEAENAVANKLQEVVAGTAPSQGTVSGVASTADELSKYAVLLEKGFITREEFDKVKKDLIGI